ncbi:MAG: protein kinase [Candidatus Aminicenantes bacterium]|nr:protein kinase [Candidatus Aminicenantes bacterium]
MKKQTIFLLLFFFLILFPSQQLFSMKWYEAYEKACNEIDKGEYAKAIDYLGQAIRERPNSESRARTTGVYSISYYPYYKLGLCYYFLGDYKNARRYFDEEIRQSVILKAKEYRDMYDKIQRADEYLRREQTQQEEAQKKRGVREQPKTKPSVIKKGPPPTPIRKVPEPSKKVMDQPSKKKTETQEKLKSLGYLEKKGSEEGKKQTASSREEAKKTEPVSKEKPLPSKPAVEEDKPPVTPVKKPEPPSESLLGDKEEKTEEMKVPGESGEKSEEEIPEPLTDLSVAEGAESVAPFTTRLKNIGDEINYIVEVGQEYIVIIDNGLPVARKANQPFVRIMEEGDHDVLIKVGNKDVFQESIPFFKGFRYVTKIEAARITPAGESAGTEESSSSEGTGGGAVDRSLIPPQDKGGISLPMIILIGAALLVMASVLVLFLRRRTAAAAVPVSDAPSYSDEMAPTQILKEQTGYEGTFAHYSLKNELSSTEMSKLYVVTPKGKKQEYILKIPNMERYGPESKKQLMDEAKLSRNLLNPNIIAIHDVGEFRGIPYYVMEYFKGMTLRELLKRSTILDIEFAIDIILSASLALEYAHKSNPPVIHKDIKPENIMLKVRDNKLEEAKLIDFGISAVESKGRVMGSPRYISPEQMFEGKADARSDIYSLGIVLYEMVLGHLPLKGRNFTQIEIELRDYIQNKKLITIPVDLDPPELKGIIEKMVHISSQERYKSVSEVIHDLRSVKFKYF